VYMQTAILPVRYEITNTGATVTSSTLKQICSTVISEGGYQQVSAPLIARRTTALASIGTSFVPMVSIRLASNALGAVVIPHQVNVLPTSAGDYEIVLVKNATLTGASYDTTTFQNVDYDVTATAMTGGTIVLVQYATASALATNTAQLQDGYNFDLQLGVSLAGVSDVYTVGVRVLSGTGDAIGSLAFYDLTQ
jgi:hypothetical protein